MKYRYLSLSMLTVMFMIVCIILTGCSSKTASNTLDSDDMIITDNPAQDNSLPIIKDKITLSFFAMSEPYILSCMGGHSDMQVYQEAEKSTNIHINWQEASYTNPKKKMNIMFDTGEMTDIIWDAYMYADGGAKRLLDDGLIVSLNPYIEKYAPNFKKILKENPELLKEISTDDGRIFMFPEVRLDKTTRANSGFVIRADWLKKSGLSAPQTIDDWYNMLKKFQEMDMNGNGKPDECFESLGYDSLSQSLANFAEAYGLIAGDNTFYVADGKVKFAPYEEAYGDFLAEMVLWYNEGLIDKQFCTQDANQFSDKILNDVGSAFYGTLGGNLGEFINKYKGGDSTYDLLAVQMPKAPDGKIYASVSNYAKMAPHGASVSSSNQHIIETVKWLDWHYSQEGETLFNWGKEGQSYEVVDDKKQFTDLILNNPDGLSTEEAGSKYAGGVSTQMPIVEDPEVYIQTKMLTQQKAAIVTWSKVDTSLILPQLYFSSDVTNQDTSIMSEINQYVSEQFYKYVMGIQSLDTLDEFRNHLKDMGIETVLKDYQESYDKVYEK